MNIFRNICIYLSELRDDWAFWVSRPEIITVILLALVFMALVVGLCNLPSPVPDP